MKVGDVTKGENQQKLTLTSLIVGVWQEKFTPQEALYILRQNPRYEINKNGEEASVLDYLASVQLKKITTSDFISWFNKKFKKGD